MLTIIIVKWILELANYRTYACINHVTDEAYGLGSCLFKFVILSQLG